jgi:hypothetical protein
MRRKTMKVSRWLAIAALSALVGSASAQNIQIQAQGGGQAQPGQPVPIQVRPGAVPAIMPFQQVGGQVIPPAAQQKLQLTDEQKKKIDDLQKEAEAKILAVLTDEQKKQYEQMKKPNAVPPNAGPRIPLNNKPNNNGQNNNGQNNNRQNIN